MHGHEAAALETLLGKLLLAYPVDQAACDRLWSRITAELPAPPVQHTEAAGEKRGDL